MQCGEILICPPLIWPIASYYSYFFPFLCAVLRWLFAEANSVQVLVQVHQRLAFNYQPRFKINSHSYLNSRALDNPSVIPYFPDWICFRAAFAFCFIHRHGKLKCESMPWGMCIKVFKAFSCKFRVPTLSTWPINGTVLKEGPYRQSRRLLLNPHVFCDLSTNSITDNSPNFAFDVLNWLALWSYGHGKFDFSAVSTLDFELFEYHWGAITLPG